MKNYVYLIVVFLISLFFLRILDAFGFSYLLSLVVAAPILFYTIIYLTIRYNFRESLNFQEIPSDGYDLRRSDLERNNNRLYNLDFTKFDEFYLKLANDVVVYVYQHNELSIYLCDYHFGSKHFSEYISRFENGYTLTTSNTGDSGLIPRRENKMLQIFPEKNLNALLDQHLQTIGFLKTRQFHLEKLNTAVFKNWFISEYQLVGEVLKNPLSPVKLFYWKLTGHKKKYIKSIQKQVFSNTQKLI